MDSGDGAAAPATALSASPDGPATVDVDESRSYLSLEDRSWLQIRTGPEGKVAEKADDLSTDPDEDVPLAKRAKLAGILAGIQARGE